MGERERGRDEGDNNFRDFDKTLHFLTDIIQSFLRDIKESEKNLSSLQGEIKNLSSSFEDVYDITKENEKSIHQLDTSVKLLEKSLTDQTNRQNSFETKAEKKEEARNSVVIADKSGQWGLRIALLTSSFAIVAAIVNSVLTYLK